MFDIMLLSIILFTFNHLQKYLDVVKENQFVTEYLKQ